MYTVADFYKEHAKELDLELIAGSKGIKRPIRIPEAHRPGLSLSGYLKNHAHKRIVVFGKAEIEYLRDLNKNSRIERLEGILNPKTPSIIIARKYNPPKELMTLCNEKNLPLLRTSMSTMNFLRKLTGLLDEEFSQKMSCHGTLVEVYGVGVLITGNSSVGKSEAALGLIERGHRLITDDVVRIRRREGNLLEGYGAEHTRHHMEIRGIGIINVAHLYGAVCVRDSKSIDIVVELETWDNHHFYDRAGLDDRFCDILDIKVPHHILPVKPGRDVVLLLETIALNHRLKEMGYNSAKEFNSKLLQMIKTKGQRRTRNKEDFRSQLTQES